MNALVSGPSRRDPSSSSAGIIVSDAQVASRNATGSSFSPICACTFANCAERMRCLFASPSDVRAKSPCASAVFSMMSACAASTLFAGVSASLVLEMSPISNAFWRMVASSRRTP